MENDIEGLIVSIVYAVQRPNRIKHVKFYYDLVNCVCLRAVDIPTINRHGRPIRLILVQRNGIHAFRFRFIENACV
ncbi:hypothetical protein SDC9_166671 [bioreactor metagenome]|uniref:Uncharacterized protein n=1 Tax=bioreactor metagenome TaxID=1076179 RepID=A0A645G585_9ZZZZ